MELSLKDLAFLLEDNSTDDNDDLTTILESPQGSPKQRSPLRSPVGSRKHSTMMGSPVGSRKHSTMTRPTQVEIVLLQRGDASPDQQNSGEAIKTDLTRALIGSCRQGNVEILAAQFEEMSFEERKTLGPRLLHTACQFGQNAVVRFLLDASDAINDASDLGITALHIACTFGQEETVDTLLKEGANVNASNDHENETPLYLACARGFPGVVKTLLQWKADIEACTHDSRTPLFVSCVNDHYDVARILLEAGADWSVCDAKGFSPLHAMAQEGNIPLVEALLSHNASVHCKNEDGSTALHLASLDGHVDIARILLEHGAHIDEGNSTGDTPLMCCVEGGSLKLVNFLVASRANVNATNNENQIALHFAVSESDGQMVRALIAHGSQVNICDLSANISPLYLAVMIGDVDIVRTLLASGADVSLSALFDSELQSRNSACNSSLPLGVACAGGYLSIVQSLVAFNASVNALDDTGKTALNVACQHGHVDIVNCLLAAMKKESETEQASSSSDCQCCNDKRCVDVNKVDNSGATALLTAAREGDVAIVSMLLQAGANPNLEDSNGNLPLYCAARLDHVNVCRVLCEFKADGNRPCKESMPLHAASNQGNVEICSLLLDAGSNIDSTDRDGSTPLHLACGRGNNARIEVACLLLDRSANVNVADNFGYTPLMLACTWAHLTLVSVLLACNADPDRKDNNGDTAILLISRRDTDASEYWEICNALLEAGADVNCANKNASTPISIATEYGHRDLVTLFLQHNCRLDVVDEDDDGLVECAAMGGDVGIAELLLKHGAPIGPSALACAAKKQATAIFKLLLAYRADIESEGRKYHRTALEWAYEHGNLQLLHILDPMSSTQEASSDVSFRSTSTRTLTDSGYGSFLEF